MWWRSDLSQPCQDDFIVPTRRFGRDELVLRVLCLEQGHQWGHADERGDLFGVLLRIEQPERGSPGMTDQDNLVLAQEVPQMINNGVQVCEVPGDGQSLWIRLGVEGPARTPLIPIRNDKMRFEIAIEIAEQWPLWASRAAM